MARFLALDWDQNQLHVVAANISGHKVTIQRAAVWQEQKSPSPADAEFLGKLLRERLKEAGMSGAPVLACVGRDRVILKDVRYPAVPDAEEAGLVRFQAVKELTDPIDEVVIDYTAMGQADNGEQRALVLIVRKEILQTYQTLCQAAGLKLAALTPRPFAMAAAARHAMGSNPLTPPPDPPDSAVAVVTVSERWAEVCVIQGNHLLLARSLPVDSKLAGEIRRSLIIYAGQAGPRPVRALYLSGGAGGELRQRLNDLLPDLPIHAFDPLVGATAIELPPALRGSFAGAAGLLYRKAEAGGLPINFAQPRQPKPVADPNRQRILIGAALVVLLMVGTFVFGESLRSSRAQELADLEANVSDADKSLNRLREDNRKLKALADWDGLPWLDELYDLVHRVPDIDKLRISSITCEPLTRGKGKYVARLTIKGTLTNNDREPLNKLIAQFSRDGYYSADPPQVDRGRFSLTVNVERRPPGEYKRELKPGL